MKNEKLQVSRNGQLLGEFNPSELELLLKREDGGLLMTDYIFDSGHNEWRRISSVITEHQEQTKTGFLLWILIIGIAAMVWNFGGLHGMWDSIVILVRGY